MTKLSSIRWPSTRHKKGYKLDTEMTAEDWKEWSPPSRSVFKKQRTGSDFPQDPYKQLELATEAVFKSWNGKRAIDYRRATNIPDDLGTAVNIVTMVFGNMGDDSGTGVAFTRNPSTGDKKMMGDYLLNAQGEDVVAGIRNTDPIETWQEIDARSLQAVHGDHRQASKSITRTCRTSNSPSSAASCGCSKPATASAPPSPPSRSPWIWRTKA
jgi:phosphoenolpyruvate synthase/pyruvate phosphate dikinase